MRGMMVFAMIIALGAPADAKPALRDVPAIDDGLFAVAVADVIRTKCPDISARLFRAYRFVRGLEQTARDLGYTDAEIDAHLDSDIEKGRLRARGIDYFDENGVVLDAPQTYCALGRAEIQKSSLIGALLRVN